MDTARIAEILTDPVTVELAERQPIMQIAYAAADGSPGAVPLGNLLREGKFLFFTIPSSDKVAALHRDPRIARRPRASADRSVGARRHTCIWQRAGSGAISSDPRGVNNRWMPGMRGRWTRLISTLFAVSRRSLAQADERAANRQR